MKILSISFYCNEDHLKSSFPPFKILSESDDFNHSIFETDFNDSDAAIQEIDKEINSFRLTYDLPDAVAKITIETERIKK